MIAEKYQVAWQYHQNTCRWRYNIPPEPDDASKVAPFKEYVDLPVFELPKVELPDKSLEHLLLNRHSCRAFSDASMSLKDLSTILQFSYGVNRVMYLEKNEFLERPVPSGGGLYPLELYVLVRNVSDLDAGVYHYNILSHCLEQITKVDLPPYFLSQLFMNQFYMSNCGAVILMTSVLERNMWKYTDRGYRYILFEAGHVAQNINLLSLNLDLGSLNMGGFFDQEVTHLLNIDEDDEIPLYAVAIGKASTTDREKVRIPMGLNFQ